MSEFQIGDYVRHKLEPTRWGKIVDGPTTAVHLLRWRVEWNVGPPDANPVRNWPAEKALLPVRQCIDGGDDHMGVPQLSILASWCAWCNRSFGGKDAVVLNGLGPDPRTAVPRFQTMEEADAYLEKIARAARQGSRQADRSGMVREETITTEEAMQRFNLGVAPGDTIAVADELGNVRNLRVTSPHLRKGDSFSFTTSTTVGEGNTTSPCSHQEVMQVFGNNLLTCVTCGRTLEVGLDGKLH